MSGDFETTAFGKWILAGEHAVLRGHPALVFPLRHQGMTLRYRADTAPLELTAEGLNHEHLCTITWRIIDEGLFLLKINPQQTPLTGHLHIQNTVPLGEGLGASAALCVSITRWFKAKYAPTLDVFEFAKKLEHLFHGQSSGLDIAGAAATTPAIYFKQGLATPMPLRWSPHWFLSPSGETGITSHCIHVVQNLRIENSERANKLDELMADSVTQAYQALHTQSLVALANAMNQAHDCFKAWQLITPALASRMHALRQAGAIATKPTGSGSGGYILSLWDALPSENQRLMLSLQSV